MMFDLLRKCFSSPTVPAATSNAMSLDLSRKRNHRFAFAGVNYADNTPLLLDRNKSMHVAHYGGTGSGKSATMASLAEQAVYAGENVLVVDLKGEEFMWLGMLQDAARKCGIDPPIYLTSRFMKPTYLCPVMRTDWWKYGLSPQDKADALITALGIDDPQAHSYWADVSLELYSFIANEVDPEEIDDFVKFYALLERCRGDLPKTFAKDSVHAAIKIKSLSHVTMFSPPTDCHPAALEHAFDPQDLFRSGKQRLVLVSLPSIASQKLSSSTGVFIGRATLFAASVLGNQRSAKLHVVFDEAQRALSPGFMDVVLGLSRTFLVDFSAGFQDIHALHHRGIDYTSAFDENCGAQFCYSAQHPDSIKRQVFLSGEYENITRSLTYSYPGFVSWRSWSETFRAQIESRFSVNDILAISADSERFIFRSNRDHDLCRLHGLPVIARQVWHISKDEFDRRSETDWPELNERTVLCGAQPQRQKKLPTNVPVPVTGIPLTTEQPKVIRPSRRR